MSLVSQIESLIVRIGTEFKSVRTAQGPLTDLPTTAKSSLVAAITELYDLVDGKAGLDDGAPSTTDTYSSQKILDLLAALRDDLLGGASDAWDTLQELKDLIDAGGGGDATAIMAMIGNRVRYDQAETRTSTEKQTARDNIGAVSADDIGDVDTDFVAKFETAIA